MLSIGKLGSGQERYNTEKVAEGAVDYYSGEAEGQWIGRAAAQFGREGKVEPDLLTGRSPLMGEPLGLRSAPGREPVPGFNLTFSAPKSVSLTWALGGHPVFGRMAIAFHAFRHTYASLLFAEGRNVERVAARGPRVHPARLRRSLGRRHGGRLELNLSRPRGAEEK